MAANVLNSPDAVKMSVSVVRAFIEQREILLARADVLMRLARMSESAAVNPLVPVCSVPLTFPDQVPLRPRHVPAFAENRALVTSSERIPSSRVCA